MPRPRPKRACASLFATPGHWNSIARRLQLPEAAAPGGANRSAPAKPVSRVAGADGDVSLVMMLDLETEVEMKLPGRFKVSPQIAGAIKAVAGVVDVQTL